MYKKAKILFFCMIFVASAGFCQETSVKKPQIPDLFSFKSFPKPGKTAFSYFCKEKRKEPVQWGVIKPDINLTAAPCPALAADFYARNFGFFCKKELQFEKATKMPVRFRLGSLQYNDYLEQKPNAIRSF